MRSQMGSAISNRHKNKQIIKNVSLETFWDSEKLAWDSTFVDALGPRHAVKTKPKSNTASWKLKSKANDRIYDNSLTDN